MVVVTRQIPLDSLEPVVAATSEMDDWSAPAPPGLPVMQVWGLGRAAGITPVW